MNPLKHVAIIMDGNGRWGLKYKNSRNAGHKAGLVTVEKIIKTLQENSENAKSLIIEFTKLRTKLDSNISCTCQFALDNAVITNPKNWDIDKEKLLQEFRKSNYPFIDISDDELSKNHLRHMVGGRLPKKFTELEKSNYVELLYRFEFPERPGALINFLKNMK